MSRARMMMVAATLAASVPASAEPLRFGGVSGTERVASDLLGQCRTASGDHRLCTVRRTQFGPLPINRAETLVNVEGRPISLTFWLDRADYEDARQLLQGRYGTRWDRFDDGAGIRVGVTGGQTRIDFDFPANRVVAKVSEGSERTVWSLLLFVLLGLGIGTLLYRARKRRRRAPAPALSMKQVLERRMREGGELRF